MKPRIAVGASVFVEDVEVEMGGHIGFLWSDENRRSYAECDCGWADTGFGAEAVHDAWCDHVVSS